MKIENKQTRQSRHCKAIKNAANEFFLSLRDAFACVKMRKIMNSSENFIYETF